MRLTTAAVLVALTAAIPCGHDPTFGWWDTGHQIIAQVATDRLNPHATAAVKDILKNDSTGHTLVAVAGWADTVRKSPMPETYNWHFVDIPVDGQPPTYDAAPDCKLDPKKGDCVVAALAREVPILTDPNASAEDRAKALKFVTHLVGDLHQRLHCAERNGDRGGNVVTVTFFGATNEAPPFQHSPWNLHAVWDGGLIDHTKRSQAAYVKRLEDWASQPTARTTASATTAVPASSTT